MMKLRASLIVMLVVAVGLLYSPAVFANHGTGATDPTWHSDVATINNTASLGVHGADFVPAWVKTDCGTVVSNHLNINNGTGTGCHGFAQEVVEAWLRGGYFDPRGGTEFIPPSGDHHRAGWRLMMQAHFSAGAWLAGFSPISSIFPFYPTLSGAGPGETPIGTFELCKDPEGQNGPPANFVSDSTANPGGVEIGMETQVETTPGSGTTPYDLDGDTVAGAAGDNALVATVQGCQRAARNAGVLLLEFVDHHAEPLTPGRFPRYIPQERQAWVQTVVTKYTASPFNNVDNTGDGISDVPAAHMDQVFRTQHNFVTDPIGGTDTAVWFSMTDESSGPCNDGTGNFGGGPDGWCKWIWSPTNSVLCKIESTSPGNTTVPADAGFTAAACTAAGGVSVASHQYLNDFPGGDQTGGAAVEVTGNLNGTCDPGEVCQRNISNIEKAPSEIYQVIGQWVDVASASVSAGLGHAPDTSSQGGPTQALWSEFWGLSGPNFFAEEGANPNTWKLCGTQPTGGDFASENCTGAMGGIDAPLGAAIAITEFGLDPVNRWGGDLRPDGSKDQGRWCVAGNALGTCYDITGAGPDGISGTGDDTSPLTCAAAGDGGVGSACDMGLHTAEVRCVAGGDADNNPWTSLCHSTSVDGVFGNDATEIHYYREALEAGVRGFIRENRTFAFSFANGVQGNGGSLSGSIRQIMAQSLDDGTSTAGLGTVISCLNCSKLNDPQHFVRSHGLPTYEFTFSGPIGVTFLEHNTVVGGQGTIP